LEKLINVLPVYSDTRGDIYLGGLISKKISYEADIILNKCKLILLMKNKGKRGKRQISDHKILEDALRIYYAYLRGYIPSDIVEKALEKVKEEEEEV